MEMYPPPPPPGPGHAADYFYYYYPPFAAAVEEEAAAAAPRRSRVRKGEQRHSKICTAGGMRDRRMRLSLDVARRFFALQDKLGFDKASKTVQWLLDMSKAGIDDLTASISEDGSVLLDSNDLQTIADSSERNKQHIISNHLQRKSTTKESRARAREKARERTRERNRLRCCSVDAPPTPPPPPPPSMIHAACSSGYNVVDEQQPWELSGVVFPKAR